VSSTAFDADVVVVGGGPAGSSAATMLARGGRTVILFEREHFPRFHIGESLLASVNEAFDALGVQDKIRAMRFPEKWGATFGTGDGHVELYAAFAEPGGVPQPQTWQVERATFDRLLLDHALASGVDVRQGHRVVDVTFDPDGVSIEVTRSGSNEAPEKSNGAPEQAQHAHQTVRARAMIDASGRWGLLARKFSLRVDEPRLANIGIFSHYSGVPRQDGRRAGDIRVIARDDLGWFWLIPINAELMSVGVVLRRDVFDRWPRMSHEEALDRAIGDTPAIARLLRDATREWPVRVEKDFSYGSKGYAGDRWLLAGDAGSFLDPVFSTGVAIALESGVEAGRAMHAALDANDLTAARFATFSARQRARYLAFRRFVVGFYSRHFRDLFFQPDPPKPLFNAVVRLLAGYWQPPTLTSRLCLEAFYGAVWLHQKFHFVDPVPGVGTAPRALEAPSQ
jgi:FADH2-dependent halogenase